MKEYIVCIPTLNRVESQPTLGCMPKSHLENVRLVPHKDEAKAYADHWGEYFILPCPVKGIAPTRQWIMENAKAKYVIMFDDDMTFNVRTGQGVKIKKCKHGNVGDMIDLLVRWLDEGFVHVGVSARQNNHQVEEEFIEIGRMNNAYGFNVKEFHKAGAAFRLQLMEDFDVTLTLLGAGLPNRVTYKYAWGQMASGAKGGCSSYRNDDTQRAAAFALKKLHPFAVSVVKKTSAKPWGGFKSATRYDVNIGWKKAFKSKLKKDKGLCRFI